MIVVKTDGLTEEYSVEKVRHGIFEACKVMGVSDNESFMLCNTVANSLYVYDNIKTTEIRRQVEEALMSINKKVAKEYISKFRDIYDKNRELKKNCDFIGDYITSSNAATGSKFDANANVESKNVVTMGQELYKGNNIAQNRYIMHNKIKLLYNKKLADQYIKDLESHILYKHDESGIPGMPYCVAITMYPFLIDGLTKLGGQSIAPTDLKSYCGEFINLVYSVSSQFMGAVATPEFLMYMDYFIRKDYGEDYIDHLDDVVELSVKRRTIKNVIDNSYQQVVHSMNMPAGNRGYQTVFWNIGYFDEPYFNGVFGNFTFPDGSKPIWKTLSWLQKHFMKWFNKERTKYTLTFPVETMAMLTDGHDDYLDKEYADFASEMWSEGHSFFCYLSDSPDSLSSCCRLRNSLKDIDDEHNHTTHQYSMGTASVATGSKSVMTINIPRLIQNTMIEKFGVKIGDKFKITTDNKDDVYAKIKESISEMTERVHKYQRAFNEIIKDFYNANMLDVYSAGFIDMKKQYLTIGVNGMTDAAEYLGLSIDNNEGYKEFTNNILETINVINRKDKTKELMYNTEFIPAENLAVKHYNWDKNDGYWVSPCRNLYSSYFYNPEDKNLSVIDKLSLHGRDFVSMLDGGSAAHINLSEHLSKEQYRHLLKVAAAQGCNYFTFNVKNTVCNDCGYISKDTLDVCPKCGSRNLDYLTRIIGYLKRVSSFSEARQSEESIRNYIKL